MNTNNNTKMKLDKAIIEARTKKQFIKHKNWKGGVSVSPDFLDAILKGLIKDIHIDQVSMEDECWELC